MTTPAAPRLASRAYAAMEAGQPLVPWEFTRRTARAHDVLVDIAYCGVCRSDIHFVDNDLGISQYPIVPGHEIVGKVTAVGSAVTKFKAGDSVGIGVLVDSCRDCASCRNHLEQYCLNQATYTYSLPDRQGDGLTYGGYSNQIACHQDFVLKLTGNQPLHKVAPLLCAGITMYSPLRRWKVGAGQKVAILGLGGLGHMGVKLAASMGAEVTVLSGTPAKREDAQRLGAKKFVHTKDAEQMKALQGSFDLILDTASVMHEYDSYLSMLKMQGTMVCVGLTTTPAPISLPNLIFGGRNLTGSLIGGLAETQEMLDYCASRGISAEVEVIGIKQINEAYARIRRSDVKYRFVIDLSTL